MPKKLIGLLLLLPRFFMPHGLTIDSEGNTWLTDVAMHQVSAQYAVGV